jgi:hypothetical protein
VLTEWAQCAISSTCAGWQLAATLRFTVTLFRLRLPLATAAQRRNRRITQDEVSARLARVEPDDRTTQRGECETFRLGIQIAELPRLEDSRSPATRRQVIEPRNRGRLVTEKIEAAVQADLEVTEVGAGFDKCFVWTLDREGNEAVAAFVNRPPLAVRQRAAADQALRLRMWREGLQKALGLHPRTRTIEFATFDDFVHNSRWFQRGSAQ